MPGVVPTGVESSFWHLQRLLSVCASGPVWKGDDYVLFGSAVLWLHGIRDEIGDVDVFVSRSVWGLLLAMGTWTVETPRAGDPPFLEIKLEPVPIHVFYDWTERDREWMNVEQCFESAEVVNGWRCISLEVLRQHKALAHSHNLGSARHEKHERDLVLIDEHLARRV